MIEPVIAVLLAGILVVLIEARISIGTRVAVMERDLSWISASLVKWGMVVPRDRELVKKQ
jgi:hypothetical protein